MKTNIITSNGNQPKARATIKIIRMTTSSPYTGNVQINFSGIHQFKNKVKI